MKNMLFSVLWISSVFASSQEPSWAIPSVVLTPPENSVPTAPTFPVDPLLMETQPTVHQKIRERYRLGQCEMKPTPCFMERKRAHLKECVKLCESENSIESEAKVDELAPKRVTFKPGSHEIKYFSISDGHNGIPIASRPIPEPCANPASILKRRSDEEIDDRPAKKAKAEITREFFEDGSYTSNPNWLLLSSGPEINENRVVIYPLHVGTTAEEVFQYYKKFGPPGCIKRISVVTDEGNQRPAVAFIDFVDKRIAEHAIFDGMKRRCPSHKILSDNLTIDYCPFTFTFSRRILVILAVNPETLQKFNSLSKYSFWTVKKKIEGSDPETGYKWTRKLEICQASMICKFQEYPNQLQVTFHSRNHLEAASRRLKALGFVTFFAN